MTTCSPSGARRSSSARTTKKTFVSSSAPTAPSSALRLPYPVDPERVQASFEKGVLTVTVPKTEQQERSRRIPV
ncbi:MAG TPA: Hsp20 family protein [Rhizobiaceae bacterium]|nr:Hsp20 family protein [Rhizobiaceae bacterium]